MIAYIAGTLAEINTDSVIVDSNGIGYEIFLYDSFIRDLIAEGRLNTEVKIVTYLDVKEDSMRLFGFPSFHEKSLFKNLISVSGVGPKGAQSILNELGPDNLLMAIASNDHKAISKANGIGPKTAQKVVLELKDKISTEGIGDTAIPNETIDQSNINDAVEALCSLGYTKSDALKAIKQIEGVESMDSGEIVRKALRYI